MGEIKAPQPVIEELLGDYTPLGTQTAKIGDSANGVVIVSDKSQPESRHSVKIGPLEKATAELENYRVLANIIGSEHTLPLGKVKPAEDRKSGEQYGALIMPYVPDLQPFSRQDLYVPKYGHTRERRMGEFAELLAKIHSGGLLHGDFQAKNVGNRANGLPMVFDLEASLKIDPKEEPQIDPNGEPRVVISKDLLSFYKSLAVKSLYGLNPSPLMAELEESVLQPWLDEIENIGQLSVDMALLSADKANSDFKRWISNGGLERAKARFAGNKEVKELEKAA